MRRSVFGHHVGLRYACAAIVIISSCHMPHIVLDLSFMKYNYESFCLSLRLSALFHSFIFLSASFISFIVVSHSIWLLVL